LDVDRSELSTMETIDLPAEGASLPAAPRSFAALAFLAQRRSLPCRHFGEPGPSPAELDLLLRVALRVPDHGKLEPWRLVVIEGAARERLGTVIAARFHDLHPEATEATLAAERQRLTRAPLVVAVLAAPVPSAKIPEWEQILSAGALCHQLLLAANALGYAAQWLTEWYAFDATVLEALGGRDGERVAGFVHVGTPLQAAEERRRPDVAAKVTQL
jgi:nitroreductase